MICLQPLFGVFDRRPSSAADARPSASDERRAGILAARLQQQRGNAVRHPERQAFVPHQRIRQLGERRPAFAGASGQPRHVEVGAAHGRRHQRDGARRVAEHRRDERLQVVLGIDDVAEGRVVDGGDDRLRLADGLAADGAGVLERDRDCASAA